MGGKGELRTEFEALWVGREAEEGRLKANRSRGPRQCWWHRVGEVPTQAQEAEAKGQVNAGRELPNRDPICRGRGGVGGV